MKLQEATAEDKKGGWTLAPSFLKEIQSHLTDSEECPSLEQIEMTLLALKKVEEMSLKTKGKKLANTCAKCGRNAPSTLGGICSDCYGY